MAKPLSILNRILPQHATPRASEYTQLIAQIFKESSVVALVGAGFGNVVTAICEALAAELSRQGKRVVVVSVNALLQASPIALSDEAAALPGVGRDVWFWPSPAGQPSHPLKPRTSAGNKEWLASLRQDFDYVLLDCPALETAPGGAAIAAMAQSTILAVDAARTPKHQILLDQRILQLSGVKLAGCILIHPK